MHTDYVEKGLLFITFVIPGNTCIIGDSSFQQKCSSKQHKKCHQNSTGISMNLESLLINSVLLIWQLLVETPILTFR